LRKADSQFFDSFMLVIGILMGAAVGLFFLVRAIAIDTQGQYLKSDPEVLAEVSKRLEPVGHVMKLGDAELAAAAAAVSASKPVAAPMTGPQVYNAVCVVCHAPPGNAGAPYSARAGAETDAPSERRGWGRRTSRICRARLAFPWRPRSDREHERERGPRGATIK